MILARGIHGCRISDNFSFFCGSLGCLSSEWDETYFNSFVMKEPDYNIIMMSTFSGLYVPECQKE